MKSSPAVAKKPSSPAKSSSSKKRNHKQPGKSLWGNLHTKAGRSMAKAYLDRLKSAEQYATEGGIQYLKMVPPSMKERIMAKLKEVDPEGYEKLRGRMISRARRIIREKRLVDEEIIPKEAINENIVMVETEVKNQASMSVLRIIPLGGLKSILALTLAAGYTREEVAAMTKIDLADLNSLVKEEDIKEAVKATPDAIIKLADQKVLRDLIAGEIGNNTDLADKIASRRKKLVIEASGELRAQRQEGEDLQKRREDHLAKRFGVDRTTGVVIDAEEEK